MAVGGTSYVISYKAACKPCLNLLRFFKRIATAESSAPVVIQVCNNFTLLYIAPHTKIASG